MAAITKEEYEFFKSQNPKDLTQEELNWINEYEKAEAGAPSSEDIEWATFILNERDPQIQAVNRKNGDFDKAMKLLYQNSAARQVMQQKGQDVYVRKVETTPEDVINKGGFQFNWRNVYENVKNEKLRPTEADAKKLQDFINSNMYNVDDNVNLQQIAYNLHMYNPNTMNWSDFIKSDQGAEFKKYIEDVKKSQIDKRLEDIWNGKDDKTFGDKASTAIMNFMLPVSKEYAKNHYNDEDFSIAGPLVTDAAANLIMTGTGALPSSKLLNKPLVSYIYGNVGAPAITETGNAIFNDESIKEALARTAEGTFVNVGTPRIIEGILSSIGRGLPTKEGKRTVQKMIDEAANKASEVNGRISKGVAYPVLENDGTRKGVYEYVANKNGNKKFYSSDPELSKQMKNKNYKSLSELPPEVISDSDYLAARQGLPFTRGKKTYTQKSIQIAQDKDALDKEKLLLLKAQSLAENGDLRNLTPVQLRQLGFSDKESFMNYLIRSFKNNTPETIKTYLTNFLGRPDFGREAGPIENINRILGTSLFKKENTEEKQKSRIQRLLGM